MSTRTAVVLGSNARYLVSFRGALVRALQRNGFTVLALAPDWDSATERDVQALGGTPVAIELNPTGTNPFLDFLHALKLARLFLARDVSLSYCYTAKCIVYGSLAAAIARVPRRSVLIAGLGAPYGTLARSNWRTRLSSAIARFLYFLTVRLNHVVFFQNDDDLNHFVENGYVSGSRAARVRGSGIDLGSWKYHEPPPVPVRFVCVTRLLEDKGVREFVAAAQLVKQRYPEALFQLVGGADASPHAIPEAQVKEWHDTGLIHWAGHVPDVRPFLVNSSVFVLPSYYREGLPRSGIEALAIGRAVITTNEPGCKELVSRSPGPNGFLVAARDVPALVNAMEQFLADPRLIQQMSHASRRLAEEHFDVTKLNASILERLDAGRL